MTEDMIVAKPSQSLVPLVPAKRSINLKEVSKYWVLITCWDMVSIFDPIRSISLFPTRRSDPTSEGHRFFVRQVLEYCTR
jgi:hypothetical protein